MLIQVTSAISECSFQDWSPKLTIYHKLLFSRPKSKVYEITSWSPHNPDAGIKSKLKVDYLWNHNPDAGIKFDAVSSKYLPRQLYNLSPCLSKISFANYYLENWNQTAMQLQVLRGYHGSTLLTWQHCKVNHQCNGVTKNSITIELSDISQITIFIIITSIVSLQYWAQTLATIG